MKTKAAILEELHKHLVIDELEVPELEVGQVLVDVKKAAICGRQIQEISGAKGPDKYLPHLMGHEGGGIVVDTGPGVSTVKRGDHVVLHWRKGPGIEAAPPKYRRGLDFVGAGPVATFTQMAVVSENRITPISDNIEFEIAALMGCAVTTGLGLINNEAKLKIGQSIAVIGAGGGVGLNVIQGAALVSAYPIIAIDIHKEKLDRALEFGASHTLSFHDIETPKDIKYIAGNRGVDVFVECTGHPGLIDLAYGLTAPGGKTIMVGQPHSGKPVGLTDMADNFTGKILMDSEGGQTDPGEDIPRYLELYKQNKLKLVGQITHEFPLDDINKAIATVIEGRAGKVIINL